MLHRETFVESESEPGIWKIPLMTLCHPVSGLESSVCVCVVLAVWVTGERKPTTWQMGVYVAFTQNKNSQVNVIQVSNKNEDNKTACKTILSIWIRRQLLDVSSKEEKIILLYLKSLFYFPQIIKIRILIFFVCILSSCAV